MLRERGGNRIWYLCKQEKVMSTTGKGSSLLGKIMKPVMPQWLLVIRQRTPENTDALDLFLCVPGLGASKDEMRRPPEEAGRSDNLKN